MAWTHAGQYGPEDLRRWNAIAQQLTYPASIQVFQLDGTTVVTLYTNNVRGATAANPLPVNVVADSPGVDVDGNLLFFAEPGRYKVVMDGTTHTVIVPVLPDDLDARLTALETGIPALIADATSLD